MLYLISSIQILAEYERGVIFRLGKLLPHPKGPGIVLVFRPIDRIVRISLRTVVHDVPPQDIITRDNVSVKVNAVVFFRVIDSVMRSNSYSFPHVLATYLVFFGVGSALGSVVVKRTLRPDRWFLALQFLVGVAALAGLVLLVRVTPHTPIADRVASYFSGDGFDFGFENADGSPNRAFVPVFFGVLPMVSASNAEFLAHEVPGISIPDPVVERMKKPTPAEQQEEGMTISRELIDRAAEYAPGYYIIPPFGNIKPTLALVSHVRKVRG